jgi:hypothetical protein
MADALPRSAFSHDAPPPRRLPRSTIERIQRLRAILDLSELDLQAIEAQLGPFAESTWGHRRVLADARRAWGRLSLGLGPDIVARSLASPPAAVVRVGNPKRGAAALVVGGRTYLAMRVFDPPPLVRTMWRVLPVTLDTRDEPYYVTRLRDGSSRCDCADWYFRIAEQPQEGTCKHIAALDSLGWL